MHIDNRYIAGFCPGCALAPFAPKKIAEGTKKHEGALNFSDQKQGLTFPYIYSQNASQIRKCELNF